jgi:stage II sporulation protein P
VKIKGKLLKLLKAFAAFALALVAVFCVVRRLPECFDKDSGALAAAAFTLADGKYRMQTGTEPVTAEETIPGTTEKVEKNTPAKAAIASQSVKRRDKKGYYDSFAAHSGEEKYEVAQKQIGFDGTAVADCCVKNKTGLDFDFEGLLKKPLTFKTEKDSSQPQVLIYHTHTTEAYLDESVDYFYESYYSRTQNTGFNVTAVGDKIAETLEKNGIKTIHDTTVHDSTYNGAYDRSARTVYAEMEDHSSIRVVLDIHRDALGTEERKVKPVFEYGGRQAAQIMVLSGCDYYGERGFDNWKNNLSFALKIQNTAEQLYPGMTRPMSFDFFAYNEYICDGSLLIEIGSDANSIEEAELSGELLGNVLAKVLS